MLCHALALCLSDTSAGVASMGRAILSESSAESQECRRHSAAEGRACSSMLSRSRVSRPATFTSHDSICAQRDVEEAEGSLQISDDFKETLSACWPDRGRDPSSRQSGSGGTEPQVPRTALGTLQTTMQPLCVTQWATGALAVAHQDHS